MLGIRSRLKSYIEKLIQESMLTSVAESPCSPHEIVFQSHGFARTLTSKLPVAADGSPLPWYTYPAIEYCNQLDVAGLNIFEYGSGNSSLYWAHKGAKVWSVEHDPVWHETMRAKSAQLCALWLQTEPARYAATIKDVGTAFDLVIIDGVWRNECAAEALGYVRKEGLIILDNSDWYTDVAGFLRAHGYFQVDFNGFGPVNNYCWTTSFFLPFRSPYLERLRQPQPLGGIEVSKGDTW